MLTTSDSAVTTAFTAAARNRLVRSNATTPPDPEALFQPLAAPGADASCAQLWAPTPELERVLRRARAAYGAGMALASLGVLTAIVIATSRVRWAQDSAMEDALAAVDADLSQAIESAKQEIDAGRAPDPTYAANARAALLDALQRCQQAVEGWDDDGGEDMFPFDRGLTSVQGWKTGQRTGR